MRNKPFYTNYEKHLRKSIGADRQESLYCDASLKFRIPRSALSHKNHANGKPQKQRRALSFHDKITLVDLILKYSQQGAPLAKVKFSEGTKIFGRSFSKYLHARLQ